MQGSKSIFWFRQDLRLSDNPGLFEACQKGAVLPIYILEEDGDSRNKIGGASGWWLYHSLKKLNESLDGNLNAYKGNSEKILFDLIESNDLKSVYWNRCYEPHRIEKDSRIKSKLKENGVECKSFSASLLWEPWEILKKDSSYYKVYTPYRNACLQKGGPRNPIAKPERFDYVIDKHNEHTIDSLGLLPTITWYKTIEKEWKVGEGAAQDKLMDFISDGLKGYKEGRNYPSQGHLSRLSPHLHFGEISPNQVWHSVQSIDPKSISQQDVDHFFNELCWREFSYYLLYHFPDLPKKNFQSKFDSFPWRENRTFLSAWKKGMTGYPIVDAGMRELWQTGYMHNRVRMIVGSFLVKNLLIDWREGAAWFLDCLLDADLANNSSGWQWVSGSGADAAPYFRIFNPVLQGEKFDPDGVYTRRFVPELAHLPNKYLFHPWDATNEVLEKSGIVLGKTYPKPMVDIKISRDRAMAAYRAIAHSSD